MIISVEKKVENIKTIMGKTVEELQEIIKQWEKKDKGLKNFFDIYDIKGEKELVKLIKIAKEHKCLDITFNIKDSDYIKKLKDIEYDLFNLKHEHIYIFKILKYYNKIKLKKCKKIVKEVKDINNIFNNIDKELSLLEKEYEEWERIPKCTNCNCIFNIKNIKYSVKSHDLENLCAKCINEELKKIIREKKFIRDIDDKYKNSKIVNKLCSKKYYDLNFYNNIYIENKEEQVDLRNDEILKYAGFDVKNDFDKYKLSNLCYRANTLIDTFHNKINFINISEWYLARMGQMEFKALCEVIGEKVGYNSLDDIIKDLNMNNTEEPCSDFEEDMDDDYIPEPPEDDYEFDDIEEQAMRFGSSMSSRQKLTKVIF